MTQIRDDSTFTSNGGIKKLKYIDQHVVAFEARDIILRFSKKSAIILFTMFLFYFFIFLFIRSAS